ncbi:hypothetical protein A9Q84_03180 [Halobacteriovorax marinus]|uniref:DUF4367 domain-containing protein n=1 Tax=Halobacteriovorax marinus TaxID=97084 RepID=A0A1Y5FCX1_9BACT|nr:hypothetical protein A9Q84_03180 [Halobacteriovorax marinus]
MKLKTLLPFLITLFICSNTYAASVHESEIRSLVKDLNSLSLESTWRAEPLPTLPLIYFSSNILTKKKSHHSISVAYFDSKDKKISAYKKKLKKKHNVKEFYRVNLKDKSGAQFWHFGKKFSYSVHVVGLNTLTTKLKSQILKKVLNHEKSF